MTTSDKINQCRQVYTEPLPATSFARHEPCMDRTFNKALIWHMDRHGTGVAELSRATGVSLNAIKQMRIRPNSSTSAENAAAISRYYGKSLNQFLECDESVLVENLVGLIELLSAEEREQLERQVRGLLQTKSPKHDK